MLPMVHQTINSPTMNSTRSGTQTLQLHHEPAPPLVGPTRLLSLFHVFDPKTLLAIRHSDPHVAWDPRSHLL
ncbi:hypothetical protein HanRHA438_Chr13g0623081 [Helianthus annuus]|nr:hypothetical protein HanRHA438_Chr13g0623081 [Helianthus annuus]